MMARLDVINPKQKRTGIPDSIFPHSEYESTLSSERVNFFLVYLGFKISFWRASEEELIMNHCAIFDYRLEVKIVVFRSLLAAHMGHSDKKEGRDNYFQYCSGNHATVKMNCNLSLMCVFIVVLTGT
jgi:hypothetical protein